MFTNNQNSEFDKPIDTITCWDYKTRFQQLQKIHAATINDFENYKNQLTSQYIQKFDLFPTFTLYVKYETFLAKTCASFPDAQQDFTYLHILTLEISINRNSVILSIKCSFQRNIILNCFSYMLSF